MTNVGELERKAFCWWTLPFPERRASVGLESSDVPTNIIFVMLGGRVRAYWSITSALESSNSMQPPR